MRQCGERILDMAASSRESRRRKILERGSDRLAFITGGIESLPSSSSPSPLQHESLTDSSQPLVSHGRHLPDQTTVCPDGVGEASGSMLEKHNPVGDAGKIVLESSVESPLLNPGMGIQTLKAPGSEAIADIQSSLLSSVDQTLSTSHLSTGEVLEPRTLRPKLFSPNQISAAISISEFTRFLCSTTVALLVILSYLGFPLLGSSPIKSVISFRPLFLLLLTNLTVVLGLLIFNNQGGSKKSTGGENKIPPSNRQDLAEQVGNALEICLLTQKVMDAVFMDVSVYAIVIVCGISFT